MVVCFLFGMGDVVFCVRIFFCLVMWNLVGDISSCCWNSFVSCLLLLKLVCCVILLVGSVVWISMWYVCLSCMCWMNLVGVMLIFFLKCCRKLCLFIVVVCVVFVIEMWFMFCVCSCCVDIWIDGFVFSLWNVYIDCV